MFKKILVPLDGSELSEAILPHVSKLAKSVGAEVVLLRVVTMPINETIYAGLPTMPVQPIQPTSERDLYAQGEGYLQRVVFDYFPDQNVTFEVSGGPTTDAILDFAAGQGVDLIAMTTHGRSGLSRTVLGSVSDEIVRRSHLPVLLWRPQSN